MRGKASSIGLSRGLVWILGTASLAATTWAFAAGKPNIGVVGCLWVLAHLLLGRFLARRPVVSARWDDRLRRLGPTGVLGGAWTALPAIVGTTLLVSIGPLSDALTRNPGWGLVAYIAVFVLAAGCGVLPSGAQAVLAGWVFGPIYGFGVALAASLVGFGGASLIGYGIARRVSGDRVARMLAEHPRGAAVHRALVSDSFPRATAVTTLVRIPRTSAFALTNLLLAASGVRIGPYLLGTVLGMLPRTAIPVWLAHRAASTGARDIQAFLAEGPGWGVFAIGIAAMLLLLALIGTVANRALTRVTG